MATSGTSSFKVHRCSRGFRIVLASAVLEWLLIFLLFIDAIFSYMVTKFAQYCELKIPCLLCSRLDHVIGDEKPGFYRNLICGDHKLEISSLVFCHIHDKLADVHGLCEACLFSFATENKSNAETCRLLVGKLGMDLEHSVDEDPLLNDHTCDSFWSSPCSCCNSPWTMRSSACRFLQAQLIAPEVGELDASSLGSKANNHFRYQGGMQERREKPSGLVLVKASHQESRSVDPLSHIGYTELKITSDTESEVPFSDDDDASALACEPYDLKEDLISQCVQLDTHPTSLEILPKNAFGDLTLEKMIHEASTSEPSVFISSVQLEVDKPNDVTSSAPDVTIGHGLEELKWHQVEQEVNASAPCGLISVDDVPASTCATEAPIEVLGYNLEAMGTSDSGTSTKESGEVCKPGSGLTTTTGLDLKTDQVSNDTPSLVLHSPDDTYKLGVLGKGSQASARLAEQLSSKESARVSEDLKLLLAQISAVRGLELSVNARSPTVHGNGDELKASVSSCSIGVQILQKKISLERNAFGFESLDGSIVSEIEGESVDDRLKRQVEFDWKSMSALHKELEEERNAAAVAANQALAMITRLQEEKVNPSAPCELISQDDIHASTCATEGPIEVLGDNLNAMGTSDTGHTSIKESVEVCKPGSGSTTATGLDLKTEQVSNDPTPPVLNSLSDKLAVLGKGSQASALLAEQLSGKDSTRVGEDLKLFLSQSSAARGLELSVNDMSPRVHGNNDELRTSDSSSSIGVHILQKKISLERNESGFESLDGSIVSEIEGESVVDRLKRQVEYDRKSMSVLYKELEEERNAASVAANQAMAMITRLQEEKAALHMEALQYLRMMEEQAEYDVEALQKANDLLAEREKEILDLEAELEIYRATFPDESMLENVQEATCDLRGVDRRVECSVVSGIEVNANSPHYSPSTRESESNDKPEETNYTNTLKSSELDFDDERLYISQCLKKLEKRLHLFSNDGVVELSNGGYSDAHEVNDLDGIDQNELVQGTNQLGDNDFSVQNSMLLSEGNPPPEERHIPVGNLLFDDKENHHIDCDRQDSTMAGGVYGLDALGNEVLDLNESCKKKRANNCLSFCHGDLKIRKEFKLWKVEVNSILSEDLVNEVQVLFYSRSSFTTFDQRLHVQLLPA
ncbi:hypothetical protein NE237_015956 [Protea cynaroides]|uniref:GTD-binding domain-containing protein n=1 Tax=Protea cynaroides TaxID=273540 RepID=A0A9Q0QRJ8_9MAGN|nr:hypothetical protein NE237_015956 [Protea cynaroides]